MVMALLRAPYKSLFAATALCRTLLRSKGRGFAADAAEQMSLIKLLRERTSAPIKEVKSALVDCGWDIEAAQKELRKRGLVFASKKSARTAAEGLLALARDSHRAAVVELNCETDFVARNEIFQHLALALANRALLLENSSAQACRPIQVGPEAFKGLKLNLEHPKISGETTVENAIAEVAAIMGENVKLRRGYTISASPNGALFSYLHTCPKPGLGRIAGILSLEVDNGNTEHNALQRVGSELAMHVVASKPLLLTKELVAPEALKSEREILKSQAQSSGKPQMAIEKMVDGRLRKYMEEVVLLEQKFVVNDSLTVKTLLDNLSKEVGSSVKSRTFTEWKSEEESKGTILKAGQNLSLKLCERSRPTPLVLNAVKDRFLNSVLSP